MTGVSAPPPVQQVTMATSTSSKQAYAYPSEETYHLQPSATPRKLQNFNGVVGDENDDVDDDDFDRALLMTGGLFENTKRKSSWSATSLRKELGSPRTTGGDHHISFDVRQEELPSQAGGDNHNHQFIFKAAEQQNHHYASPTYSGTKTDGFIGSDDTTSRRRQDKNRSCTGNTGTTFLKELGSALVSCSTAGTAGLGRRMRGPRHHKKGDNKYSNNHNLASRFNCNVADETDLVADNWVRLKDSIHKAVQGDLDAAKDAWRRSSSDSSTEDMYGDGTMNSMGSQEDSILTYDNFSLLNAHQQAAVLQQEEEAQQLRRLTSWGTVGTYETTETNGTSDNSAFLGRNPVNEGGVIEDDDGIPIDANLLNTTRAKSKMSNACNIRSSSKKPRRKRVVRFDYPPISSLRECPRTQPDQIEELFFTENELGQIEDDRYSTISADDVEIVAISTSTTGNSTEDNDASTPDVSKSPSTPQAESQTTPASGAGGAGGDQFRNYVSTPSKRKDSGRKGRRNFSFDDVVGWKNTGGNNPAESVTPTNTRKGAARRRRSGSHAPGVAGSPTSGNSRRMIKSVQIYLRERSVG